MTGFLDGPKPRAFAHRGWHSGDLDGYENTLVAFRRAVAEGFRYLETDVHATKDGYLVAFHDSRLDRVTDGRGAIADLSWDQVRAARVRGSEPIPLMTDVFEACPGAYVNIDAKSDGAVGPLLDVLTPQVLDRVCLASFSDARLAVLRGALPPGTATSLGPRQVARLATTGRLPRRTGTAAAQVPSAYRRIPVITRRFVRAAHGSGLEVHAWTIDHEPEMDRLLDLGVDGIITDAPGALRDVLARRGLWAG